jgi:hypothetical protein
VDDASAAAMMAAEDPMQLSSWAAAIAAPVLAAAVAVPVLPWIGAPASTSAASAPVMPQYDRDRALLLPENYRQWVFAGSSLSLSYDEAPGDHEMFNQVLMEPTAYAHFVQTGDFREGTMFVLVLQGADSGVLPGRKGTFASDLHGVEMAVKDRTRTPDGWAYYGFGGMGGIEKRAQPSAGCVNCHKAHGARDHVFLQFYPLLSDAAGVKVTVRRSTQPRP